jgi:glycosyltransferase involved in cell wall biosynthesis
LTARIVSVSEADRRHLIAAGWAKPSRVVAAPNGVDLTFWGSQRLERAAARRQLGWDPDAPAVIQIGRLDAQKAPGDLVQAAARIVREQPSVRVYLAGDGPLRGEIIAQVQALGLHESVILLGPRTDVPTLLAAADVVALSSLWEGMPYSLLEAGAMGRPAVCTAVDGSPEVVLDGETGYVVPPSEPAAMAQAILRLLADPARRAQMGERASQWIHSRFDVKATAAAVADVYTQVMQDRG